MRHLTLLALALLPLGCKDKAQPEGEAPPPPDVSSPCDAVPGPGALVVPGLTERAAGFCIDRAADVRSYGTGAPAPLDAACVELFNGECELYKSYGLDAVKTLRYAPVTPRSLRVNVVLTEFRTMRGAYGFLTRRILGGGPPSELTVRPLALTGQGALGAGVAYVQRGKSVLELTYVSETETPQEIEARSESVLTPLARALAESLGGEDRLPILARRSRLPEALPLTTELPPDGLLGLRGTGPYAVTHYSGEVAHRLVVIEAFDEEGAKDALRLLLSAGPSHKLKHRDIHSVRVSREESAPEVWHFRRLGQLVVGVGPALQPGPLVPPSERKQVEEAWSVYSIGRLLEASRHVTLEK